ncbi:MAG: alpha-galactosidase, partial [Clostridiales bacterium]|nr:alpha-galactosidase [Clostridiales bacterium]
MFIRVRFYTPQAALCYSDEGLGALSRAYADFLREKVIDPNYVYKLRPIVVNNWEATYFDFNNEKLFAIIDEAAKLGVDTFVLDDGWFGKRDNDRSGLGDWFVNEEKLAGGLKTVINRCKQKGLHFGLWFEPEMVNEDSDLFRAHPDWAISKDGVVPVRSRNQLVLDFTRKEVVDYAFAAVSKILKENDISYVKWDMNRFITEIYTDALPAHRQGEFMHRYILGVYDLAERLTSAFPEVFFEGCASGGGRFDAGMLYYFPQIWTSDDTDAFERTKIQWGTSYCYPVSAMSCHVSACPNHQTRRVTPLNTRGAVASLGATGYELDLSKLSEEEKKEVKEQIKQYKKIDELVLKGDLYRLCNPFESNYFAMLLVSKDKSQAYVAGERFRGDPCDYN